jgi:UDP-N-acetylglucosamine 1-carboxyvinyltransferase
VLHNVPRIRDTQAMIDLLAALGTETRWSDDNTVVLRARTIPTTVVDADIAERIRASFLAAGPLLARFGSALMPPPGGDVIGRRRLDPHLDAFMALGARVEHTPREIRIEAPDGGLEAVDFFMDEPSVMATENALMAAALTPGPTTIGNAACEPHVQDLARLLLKMGADIDGIGSNVMTVHGRDKLGGAEHRICADHIEVASFMALAAATRGELRIRDTDPNDLMMVRRQFQRLGLTSHIEGNDVLVPPEQVLQVKSDVGDATPKIEDGPWPAFPADLTSIALALATQAEGQILIFEKMFENRLFFVDKLVAMGARIILCDPHRAIVYGPSRLHGEHLESPDIRAGMAMLIAALAAEGTSEIGNVIQIDRGYERIDLRLRDLGARIERVGVEPVPA